MIEVIIIFFSRVNSFVWCCYVLCVYISIITKQKFARLEESWSLKFVLKIGCTECQEVWSQSWMANTNIKKAPIGIIHALKVKTKFLFSSTEELLCSYSCQKTILHSRPFDPKQYLIDAANATVKFNFTFMLKLSQDFLLFVVVCRIIKSQIWVGINCINNPPNTAINFGVKYSMGKWYVLGIATSKKNGWQH